MGTPGWQQTLWAAALSQAVTVLGFGLAIPFLPLYIQHLGVTDPAQAALWSGLVFAAPFFPMSIASPVWGVLSDRHGRKIMLIRSMVGGAVVLSAIGFATSIWLVLALRLLQGAVAGSIQAAIALVATTAPRRSLGVSLGWVQTAVNIGNSVGPLVGGLVAGLVGFRNSFLIGGGLVLAAAVLAAVVAVEPPRQRAAHATAGPRWSFRLLFSSGLPVLLAGQAVSTVATFAVFPLIPIYAQQLDRPVWLTLEAAAGLALAVTAIVSAPAAVWLGSLGDRWGHRRILVLCLAGTAALVVPQAFAADVLTFIVFRGLMGLTIAGLMPSLNALIKQAGPSGREGSVYGAAASAQSVGLALGPVAAAGLAAVAGLTAVFLGLAILLLIQAVWMAVALPGKEGRQVEG